MFIHNVLVFILYVLVQSYVSVVVFVWPGIPFSRCLVVMRPWCVASDVAWGFPRLSRDLPDFPSYLSGFPRVACCTGNRV